MLIAPCGEPSQGEAVAWSCSGDAYFTISEGTQPTVFRIDLR